MRLKKLSNARKAELLDAVVVQLIERLGLGTLIDYCAGEIAWEHVEEVSSLTELSAHEVLDDATESAHFNDEDFRLLLVPFLLSAMDKLASRFSAK